MTSKRYAVDEADLFHYWLKPEDQVTEETDVFPWWKPVFDKGFWHFENKQGKKFNPWLVTQEPNTYWFPDHFENLVAASHYESAPTFFVYWMRTVAYYRSVQLWNETEKKLQSLHPDMKSKAMDKLCDAEVAKFFLLLKDGDYTDAYFKSVV